MSTFNKFSDTFWLMGWGLGIGLGEKSSSSTPESWSFIGFFPGDNFWADLKSRGKIRVSAQ